MTPDFQQLMRNATRLTRTGDLQAATAAIQAALAGTAPAPTPPAPRAMRDMADVIDVVARELPDTDVTTPPRPAANDAPGTGRFIAGSHSNAASRRDFKLYIPPGAGERALPLVVMLHGCTQNPDDFAAGTAMNELARAQGFFVLYPAQSQQANPQRCWSWFKHNHQARGRGEPALLAGMTHEVMAAHAVDPERVYVAGLSAGGAMAAILGDAYPDVYAAVGVHSGLAAGTATDLPSALGAMKGGGHPLRASASGVATIVFHGDADSTVHPVNGHQVITASAGTASSVEVEHIATAGGRASTRSVHRAPDGAVLAEHWLVHGAPHAWSGGSTKGSYTDARGPDASAEMLRFFMAHPRRQGH
ncbi:MAG: PHB depolymerase family esterase [Polaromonas sp.]|uniref:extracellular catalytic domain type 1 short-chain-length polyhydroxyalkanoate depolymerase n=1 Tax=Polaromonas sp. TaxID=1869339 RepID=UPI002728DA19|nr:PHB depolymerase family esterase [Polaromonas sp.]MDO9116223.1 PHB depolymerase family esterase [Polaromonas sp.]MDP1887548.1 PHB depolymerase family esterase [Polaromonas sp.]